MSGFRSGLEAWLDAKPWERAFELRLASRAGRNVVAAKAIDAKGDIVWETQDESAEIPVFLRLPREVVEALAVEFGTHIPSADATVEALKDARGIRDRLLALVEKGWES